MLQHDTLIRKNIKNLTTLIYDQCLSLVSEVDFERRVHQVPPLCSAIIDCAKCEERKTAKIHRNLIKRLFAVTYQFAFHFFLFSVINKNILIARRVVK